MRQWFNNQAIADTIAAGRAIVEREMQREGEGRAKLDSLAGRLGFARADDLFAAVARDEINLNQNGKLVLGESIGDLGGLKASPKNYALWSRFGVGLPNAQVADLQFDALDNVLLAGTRGRGASLIPTFHPANLLRNPPAKREVWEDMKKVRDLLQD